MVGEAGRLSRRSFVANTALIALLSACKTPDFTAAQDELARLEKQSGGRLGVFILDTSTGNSFGHRHDERFGMCSTFKLALAAIILREAEAGSINLDQWQAFSSDDARLLWPDTRFRLVNGGMTIREMARFAQVTSDNGCANALLRLIGGPAGFSAKLRDLGDEVTRLDRFEPELNLVPPAEQRDTTTPRAMAMLMQQLLLGDTMNVENTAILVGWMQQTQVGLKRIRAGLPADWRAGDKPGTAITGPDSGVVNKCNDVAIFWPPNRAPIIVTAYLDGPGYFANTRDEDQAILAGVGRAAASWTHN
jgi:beta-lactamase class A